MKVDGPPAYEASIAESSIFPPHFTPLGSPLLQNVKEATNSVLLMDNEVGSTESDQHLPPLPDTKLNSPVSDSDPGYQSATLSSIPREEKRCSLFPQHSAVWIHTVTDTHLSALSAAVLIHEGVFTAKNLELYKFSTSPPDPGPSDPISGVFAAAHATIGGVVMGVADYPLMITKMIKERRPVAKGMAVEFALDGGKGISRIIGTGLNAPMEFTLGLSRGFHNVPKIYGDETVRSEERVSGMKDGLIAGGKGLGLGLFDGITGIFTQPFRGAMQDGALGGLKGFGKGIGGAVCKPAAEAIGLPAYAFKGVYQEIQKKRGFKFEDSIITAMLAQGCQEANLCSADEKQLVLDKWQQVTNTRQAQGKFKYQ